MITHSMPRMLLFALLGLLLGGCQQSGSNNGDAPQNPGQTPAASRVELSVSVVGSGSVTSTPAGITCGAQCSAAFDAGSVVTLSAAPASGFTFVGWGGACAGSGACEVTLSAGQRVSAQFNAVTPTPPTPTPNPSGFVTPIGIPTPDFGITEQAPTVPVPWDATHTTSAGRQFIYVCPSCANSTDTGNPFGYPAQPRMTVPSPIAAGSVVEVHGVIASNASFVAQGTAINPVFVRGASYAARPSFTVNMSVQGTYVILENVAWGPADANDSDFGVYVPEGASHVVLRHCEAHGNAQRAGGIGVGTWSYVGSQSASNIVVWDCLVHDHGTVQAGIDTDAHGVTLSGSVDHFWLLDSELDHNAGDGIQVEAQHGRTMQIHHVYLGRNRSHDNKQSGMWVKHATDVVISQNEIYNHRTIDEFSTGQCTGFQYNPERIWFLYNRLHDCDIGIFVASDDGPGEGTDSYFIGNVIYHIHATDPANLYSAGAFSIRGSVNRVLLNNAVYDVDGALYIPPNGGQYDVTNNIFSGRTSTTTYDIAIEGGTDAQNVVLQNNVIYNAAGPRISWGGTPYTALSAFQTVTGKCNGCLATDPRFVNAPAGNLSVDSKSPAVDAGALHPAYAAFQARYGPSIAIDPAGTTRPIRNWDIGAYEQ